MAFGEQDGDAGGVLIGITALDGGDVANAVLDGAESAEDRREILLGGEVQNIAMCVGAVGAEGQSAGAHEGTDFEEGLLRHVIVMLEADAPGGTGGDVRCADAMNKAEHWRE